MKQILILLSQIEKRNRNRLLLILAFALYLEFYIPLLEKGVINKIGSYFLVDNSKVSDSVFGLIFFFSFIALATKVSLSFWKRKPVADDFIWPILIMGIYSLHRFEYFAISNWRFISFRLSNNFKYADGLVLLILYFIYNSKDNLRKHKPEKNIPELIEDDFFRKKGSDILKRNKYAGYIAKLILNQQTNVSFAIGIKGSWGSGKSVFLKQIENTIYNAIKIRFNPWLSKSTDEVLGDFFKILIEKISSYDSGLSKSLRKYYINLVNIDENFGKKILSSFGLLKNDFDLSLEEQQRSINQRLKTKKLKLVIFIDDLDRLNAEEILSVLKLIRNSFNFPNTFFLIAYDEEYVKATLNAVIDRPEKFLEKIFQLEIDLPGFPSSLLQTELTELLSINKSDEQKTKIVDAISVINEASLWEVTVRNMRDAIRLSNSFNHVFGKKEKEVDHIDFLLLELLKLQNRVVYNDMRNSLISSTKVDYIRLPNEFKDEDEETDFITFSPTEALNQTHPIASKILKMLFNRDKNFDEVKSIRFVGNSLRYFSDDLFGNISYDDFEKYKKETFQEFKKLVDLHFQKGNIAELITKILRINFFTDVHSFFNLNKALLYIDNKRSEYTYTSIVYENLKRTYDALEKMMGDENRFATYIENLFSNKEDDALAESRVLGEILRRSLESEKSFDFPDLNIKLIKQSEPQ